MKLRLLGPVALCLLLSLGGGVAAREVNGIPLPDGAITSDEDPDSAKWVKIYTGLADRGDSWGTFKLAEWTFYGHGVVKKDVSKAIGLFERAVGGKAKTTTMFNTGAYEAAHFLAVIYDNAEDVELDRDKSIKWFIKAATVDPPASVNRLTSYAEEQSASAKVALGFVYLFGNNVEKDEEKAAEWFLVAADQGHPIAQVLAALHLKNGVGVDKDAVLAARYARASANQGHPNGEEMLGEMYLEGTGVPVDHVEAARWLLKAAEKGRPTAQYLVAGLLQAGQGIDRDPVQAYVWCNLAAALGNVDAKELLSKLQGDLTAPQLATAQERSRTWWKQHQE